jgi:glutathione-regulated potassium-efflux system ancillary protein KefG
MAINNILILFAHPAREKSKVNSSMLKTIEELAHVTINDLYEEYPDFLINVKREQELLIKNDIIIWHHPFYWYNVPALLKEWMDLVLEHNFAYGSKGNALKGKKLLSVITTGAIKKSYCPDGQNCHSITDFLIPFKQTASLCKMEYLPPFVVHGTHLLSPEQIQGYAQNYQKTLIALRDGLVELSEMLNYDYMNELTN